MNDIQIFQYQDQPVRTVQRDGEPWFVLKDVCAVLGLGTPARVAERLEEDEVSSTHLTDSLGRQQDMTIINESGLYNVILRSDKPEARPFRKWVTSGKKHLENHLSRRKKTATKSLLSCRPNLDGKK